ncbi:hypothetical protein G6F65_023093 [Rhizopus arrhizus]|nr:hypothetical protein G6F65_023093 [Rhizopus arrhizus]
MTITRGWVYREVEVLGSDSRHRPPRPVRSSRRAPSDPTPSFVVSSNAMPRIPMGPGPCHFCRAIRAPHGA